MDFNVGDRVFYIRSNGVRVPATVVGFAPDGLVQLEYFRDAENVLNRQFKVESISFFCERIPVQKILSTKVLVPGSTPCY